MLRLLQEPPRNGCCILVPTFKDKTLGYGIRVPNRSGAREADQGLGVWVAPQNRKRGWGVTLNARKLTNCIGPEPRALDGCVYRHRYRHRDRCNASLSYPCGMFSFVNQLIAVAVVVCIK